MGIRVTHYSEFPQKHAEPIIDEYPNGDQWEIDHDKVLFINDAEDRTVAAHRWWTSVRKT